MMCLKHTLKVRPHAQGLPTLASQSVTLVTSVYQRGTWGVLSAGRDHLKNIISVKPVPLGLGLISKRLGTISMGLSIGFELTQEQFMSGII